MPQSSRSSGAILCSLPFFVGMKRAIHNDLEQLSQTRISWSLEEHFRDACTSHRRICSPILPFSPVHPFPPPIIFDLLAFQIALRDSGAGALMCSYNRINGTYACENPYILTEVLKGLVVSDWGGTQSPKLTPLMSCPSSPAPPARSALLSASLLPST